MRLRTYVLGFALAVVACLAPGTAEELDPFGVKMVHPTAKDGRTWFAQWEASRSVPKNSHDPQDPLLRNTEGTLALGGGIAKAPPGQTRLYVLTPKDKSGEYTQPLWRNVEMTAYFRCDAPKKTINYQSVTLSARSGERHRDETPCDGTSYHASLRFDEQCGFKKEVWHGGDGYTGLRGERWQAMPLGRWVGIKFVCRNCHDGKHVRLELLADLQEKNEWTCVAQTTDDGGWKCDAENCGRPRDYILAEGRPAVYFRTDHVPIEVKSFSVREIDPLP